MQNRYAIVYQMGKVASTSIVATLDAIDGIDAVQSHFLGEKALASIIPSITHADVSPYFFKHAFGQYVQNVRITRQMNRIRAGKMPATRLLMISLSRDPVNWARSSVVQDVEGYLPVLRHLAQATGSDPETDAEVVRMGLSRMIETSCDILEHAGGIDQFIATPQREARFFTGTVFEDNPGAKRMFLMLLRPFDWFKSHFEVATGIAVTSMDHTQNVWEASDEHADFVIVRYEDMSADLPAYLGRKGICEIDSFKKENVSSAKPFSEEVTALFDGPEGARFRRICSNAEYATRFGYVK